MTELSEPVQRRLEEFLSWERKGRTPSGRQVAGRTLQLLRELVADRDWRTAAQLVERLRAAGRRLAGQLPTEPAVRTLFLRLLKMVREEHQNQRPGSQQAVDGPQRRLADSQGAGASQLDQEVSALRPELLASLDELQNELDISADNIAKEALGHIHADDVILTAGMSNTVLQFLRRAAGSRSFHVIVAESAPFLRGHELAGLLATLASVQVTVIAESAVFAMMSRVNKVILGTQTVLADGGLRAFSGAHAIALAAQHHSVPVLVCAPAYKLSPQFYQGGQQDGFNLLLAPEPVLPYSRGGLASQARVACPVFDYVPPGLVTLFVTPTGGVAPWYIYRLLNEYYDSEDLLELQEPQTCSTGLPDCAPAPSGRH